MKSKILELLKKISEKLDNLDKKDFPVAFFYPEQEEEMLVFKTLHPNTVIFIQGEFED